MRKIITCVAAALALTAAGQTPNPAPEKFAIKATAEVGLGNALSSASRLSGLSTRAAAHDFGFDFGYTVWTLDCQSLEANVGLGYGYANVKSKIGSLDYHYSAPAEADMDGDTYERYYELRNVSQKSTVHRLTLPIYMDYGYRVHERVKLHALAGFKLGFDLTSSVKKVHGSAFSYGIYPQYEDLMIDAPYMNLFGETNLSDAKTSKPRLSPATIAFICGAGAEIGIWGPLSADINFRYEAAFAKMFKPTAETCPVTYTVEGGQSVTPLASFLKKSRPSRASLAIALIYRF